MRLLAKTIALWLVVMLYTCSGMAYAQDEGYPNVIFNGNFENGLSQWNEVVVNAPLGGVETIEEDGEHLMHVYLGATPANALRSVCAFNNTAEYDDMAFEFEMKLRTFETGTAGLILGYQGSSNFYSLSWIGNKMCIVKNAYTMKPDLVASNWSVSKTQITGWNHYRIEVKKNTISVYLNHSEQPVYTYTDQSVKQISGKVGFMVTGDWVRSVNMLVRSGIKIWTGNADGI